VSDPIPPPAARQPEEALELASQALSDGDLEAALAQYEPQARLVTWRRPQTGADGEVRDALTCFMALRLPLAVQIVMVLRAPGLALVICERHTTGTGPGGEEIKHSGNGCAIVRAQPDGTWRIAADAWHLGAQDLGAQDLGAQDLGAQDLGAQDLGAQDLGAQDLGAQDLGAQDLGAQDLGADHPAAEDP
jgi:ketosteroid isomerase-like protein